MRYTDQLVDDALVAMDRGGCVRALAILDQVAAEMPDDAAVHWLRAKALIDLDRSEESLSEAKLAAQLDPGSPDAHFLLGCSAWQIGQYSLAEHSFLTAVRLAERDADIQAGYAGFLADQRDPHQAESVARRAIELDPDSSTGWAALAVAQSRLGRHDDAITSCRKSVQCDPEDLEAKALLELLPKQSTSAVDNSSEEQVSGGSAQHIPRLVILRRYRLAAISAFLATAALLAMSLARGLWSPIVLVPLFAALYHAYRLVGGED